MGLRGVQDSEGGRTATHCAGPPGTEGHTLGHTNTHTAHWTRTHKHVLLPTVPQTCTGITQGSPSPSLSPSLFLSLSLSPLYCSVFSAARITPYPCGSRRTSDTFIPSIKKHLNLTKEEPDSGNTPHFSSNADQKPFKVYLLKV